MAGPFGLGPLLLGAAILIGLYAEQPVAGLPPRDFAILTGFLAVALMMAGWIVNDFRHHWATGLRALALWSVAFAGLVASYVHRDEFVAVIDRVIGEVSPGRTAVTPEGEVVVARRADGSFTLAGRLNERPARFIFDTGASTVVITAETAASSGLDKDALRYTVPVSTANGIALAAPVTLDSLAIGPIVERQVRALVAKPGVLRENLLGMTFLDRLTSYEVRGNRLILRARSSRAG
jgi:aspartyl protease family protein